MSNSKNFKKTLFIYYTITFITFIILFAFLVWSFFILNKWKDLVNSSFKDVQVNKAKSIVSLKKDLEKNLFDEKTIKRIIEEQCKDAYKAWIRLDILEDNSFHYTCFDTYDTIIYKEILD